MTDLSSYNTETLRKMSEKAFSNYYEEDIKPVGSQYEAMNFQKIHNNSLYKKAVECLDAIDAELSKRQQISC